MKLVSASHLVQYNNFPFIDPKFYAGKLQLNIFAEKDLNMHLTQVVFPEPISHFSIRLVIEIFKR